MKLYSYWRSSASYRVRIALNLKGLSHEVVPMNLRLGEQSGADYLQLNPQGLVPALDLGGELLTQSLAIIEYLEETQPQPPLLPTAPLARAQVRAMAQAIACDLHPLQNLRVMRYLKNTLSLERSVTDEWYRHWVAECLAALEPQARRHSGDGRHLFGESVTLADLVLVPQMYNARRFGIDLQHYPTLFAIDEALMQLPAFAQAAPENQPDAD